MRPPLALLLLAVTPSISQNSSQPSKPSSQASQQESDRKWREYQARLHVVAAPGHAALERERARRKQHPCTKASDSASYEATLKCLAAESRITENNYLAFKGSIGGLLRLNTDAYPKIPGSDRLPLDMGEEAWQNGRDAICAATANPRHTPESPPPHGNREDMRLGCIMFLTQEHMEDLSSLYFLVLEGT